MYFQIIAFIFVLGNLYEAREVREEHEVREASVYKYLALEMHNEIRAYHNAAPLKLDHDLSHRAVQCAAEYAETTYQNGTIPGRLCREKYTKGESILYRPSKRTANFSIEIAMQYWHNMESAYFYDSPAFYEDPVSHFSTANFVNIVWKLTTKLGCGVQTRKNRTVTVCLYDPPGGNQTAVTPQDVFQTNVERPKGEYQDVALVLHNQLRNNHNSRPMKPSDTLTRLALDCANWYSFYGNVNFYCSNTYEVSENVYFSKKVDTRNNTMRKAISLWYDTKKNYDYETPKTHTTDAVTFTNLVWRASTELGCAVDFRGVVAVCVYSPPGSCCTEDDFKKNVLKPETSKKSASIK